MLGSPAQWLGHSFDLLPRLSGGSGRVDQPRIPQAYKEILTEIADASGGGTLVPPRTMHDCPDHEDNLVLDLAGEVGALLLVSEDTDLTSMSPWRGVPILRASEFTARVDAMRRHQRRRTAR